MKIQLVMLKEIKDSDAIIAIRECLSKNTMHGLPEKDKTTIRFDF